MTKIHPFDALEMLVKNIRASIEDLYESNESDEFSHTMESLEEDVDMIQSIISNIKKQL